MQLIEIVVNSETDIYIRTRSNFPKVELSVAPDLKGDEDCRRSVEEYL